MLQSGDRVPDFKMEDADGKCWTPEELRGQRFVLYFYPADDTPGCTVESCDFRDAEQEFSKAGYQIFGVSPQGAASHKRFAAKYSLGFPLLIDEGGEAAKAFGAVKESEKLRIKRSTFVVDDHGIIEHALHGVSAKGHVASLRELLEV
jgi:peroxiredoxin Q/BCP